MAQRSDTLHFEGLDDETWKNVGADEWARTKRLPEAEIKNLRFLWAQLPSRLGLGSNFGALIERLQSLSTVDRPERRPRARRPKPTALQGDTPLQHVAETETPAAALERRAREATSHLPEHVRFDLPPEEPRLRARARREGRRINGTLVARGFREDRMMVKHDGGGGTVHRIACDVVDPWTKERYVETVEALFPAEEWCGDKERAPVRSTRAALEWMQDHELGREAVVLFAMYSGEIPRPSNPWWAHKDCLDDLWPLALHSETVRLHAAELSTRRQATLARVRSEPRRIVRSKTSALEREWLAGGQLRDPITGDAYEASTMLSVLAMRELEHVPGHYVYDPSDDVSMIEAAHHILDKPGNETHEHRSSRKYLTSLVKIDGQHLLEAAGDAYLKAKAATRKRAR